MKYAVAGVAVAGVAAVGASAYYKYSYLPSQVPATKVSVKMGILSNLAEAPMLVAADAGLFKKYNIEAELVSFSSAPGQIDAFQANKIDLSDASLPQMVSLATGANFYGRLIHTLGWIGTYQGKVYPEGVAMVRTSLANSVKSVTDLRGKTIATLGLTTFDWAVGQTVLKKAGINPSTDIKVVTLSYPAIVEGFATGNIDATFHLPVPFNLAALSKGYAKVLNDPTYDPNGLSYVAAVGTQIVPINGIWANDAFLKTYPSACGVIARGVADGVAYIQSHPDETASIVSKHTNISVDIVKEGLTQLLYVPYPSGFTDWQTYFPPIEKLMLDLQLIKQSIDLKPFVTSTCFNP